MPKIKTSELTGPALDWAVAECEGIRIKWSAPHEQHLVIGHNYHVWRPSAHWAQGGPIIEREGVGGGWSIYFDLQCPWYSFPAQAVWVCVAHRNHIRFAGPTPLIAAMRCFVASKLGEEVDVPEELA